MKSARSLLFSLVACLLVIGLVPIHFSAQAIDENDLRDASLTYGIEQNGLAYVTFYCSGSQALSAEQQQLIGQSLGLVLKEHKTTFETDEEIREAQIVTPQSPTAKQIISYSAQGQITFPLQNGVIVGEIKLDSLLTVLRAAEYKELQVLISHPDLGYANFPQLANSVDSPDLATDFGFHQYRISLQQPPLKTLTFTIGEPASFRWTQYGLPIALLITPLLLTLTIGLSKLRKHRRDPGSVTVISPGFLVLLGHSLSVLWWMTLYLTKADRAAKLWLQGRSEWVSTLASIALYVAPPLLVVLLCQVIHQYVVSEIKGDKKTLGQLLRQTALQIVTSVVPSLLFIYGMVALVSMQGRKGLAYFALFFLLTTLAGKWQWKAMGLTPYIVPSGSLRNQIFALAGQAGVKLREAFLIADTNGRTINAFASSGENVLLTEYLLSQFSRREIDFIIGHELAHLQRKHIQKNVWIAILTVPVMIFASSFLSGVVMVTLTLFGSLFPALLHWGTTLYLPLSVVFSLALIVLGKMFLSRRFEYEADAGGVALTNDPEAAMTALVKLGKLNLEPMDWGKLNGKLLTHPSVKRRVQAVARAYQITDEQVAYLMTMPDADPSRYAVHTETNDALKALPPASEPKQANLPQTGEPRLLLTMSLWAVVGMILTWVSLTPGYAPHDFMMQLHIPAWAVIGTVGVLIAVRFCAHLKKTVLKSMNQHQEFLPVEVLDCPAITSAAEMNTILAYTCELESLGFQFVSDYTVAQNSALPMASFARLFVHPVHHCYAEVSHIAGKSLDRKMTWCSMMSSLTNDLAFSTTNQQPDAMLYATRTNKRLWSCHTDSAPQDLLEIHLEQRARLQHESRERVSVELSRENYFGSLRQFSALRRKTFRRTNILRFMFELDTFKRAPKNNWWGKFSVARPTENAAHTQRTPIYGTGETG
jgi:Zn-dependent protease with chaperone function